MKSGLTIVEMAQQIERQSKLKQDYLLDTRRLQVEPFGSQLYLHTFDDHDDPLVEPLEINQIAHRQIGTHLKIPAAYYDRMLSDYPELLAENVNSWFQREPTQRMVRTLDGTVRAFLSNRYRRIDNLDIAEIVLPVIQQMEDAYFESCQITDSRMYIKVVNKRLEAEVVPGDIVQSGVIISNSEVGLGSVNIQPLVYRLVCSNGMVVNDAQTRRTHIGRVNEADENFQLFSQETLAADDHAFAMKIKDTVMAAVDETRFTRVVGMMREATTVQMNTTDIPGVVRLASKDFNITDYRCVLSLRDPADKKKYHDDDAMWNHAENALREVLTELGIHFTEEIGEAAFYGPKLDVNVKPAVGAEYTLSTCQLDFCLPAKFHLTYVDKDGTEKTPVVLHRAILGSLDRFMAYLIEETKGKFPTWLAPVQVKVLPVSEKTLDYAQDVTEKLVEAGVRVALDDDNQKIGYKIRAAQQVDRVPYMLVLGAKEAEAGNISVRDRKGETTTQELDAFINNIVTEIKERRYN